MEIDSAPTRLKMQYPGDAGDKDSLKRSDSTENTPVKEVVYTPDGHLGLGLKMWIEMVMELVATRELTWQLFLRDFSARYRQSALGLVWAILPVLVTTATFSWLSRANVLPVHKTILPYPVFLLVGMSVWQLFASGLANSTQALVSAAALITKINFPRETLIIAAFGQAVFEFLIRIVLLAAGFVLFHVTPHWTVILIPFAIIPLCLFTIGLGLIFGLINGVLRDAGQIVTFLLTFWMFLTPVVYPAPEKGTMALVNVVNPVSPFVIAAQDLTSVGHLTQPLNYAIGCGVSLIVFLIAWRIFHLAEMRIAERV